MLTDGRGASDCRGLLAPPDSRGMPREGVLRVLRFLRFLLLIKALMLIGLLWLGEVFMAAIGRHPGVMGGSALGAAAIIRWWSDFNLRLLTRVKMLLGRYLRNYPRLFRQVRWMLVPRR